jgi:hypothetical protein
MRVLTAARDDLTSTNDAMEVAIPQRAGAFSQLEKARDARQNACTSSSPKYAIPLGSLGTLAQADGTRWAEAERGNSRRSASATWHLGPFRMIRYRRPVHRFVWAARDDVRLFRHLRASLANVADAPARAACEFSSNPSTCVRMAAPIDLGTLARETSRLIASLFADRAFCQFRKSPMD